MPAIARASQAASLPADPTYIAGRFFPAATIKERNIAPKTYVRPDVFQQACNCAPHNILLF
jgi:hypothetical protein